MASDHLDGPLLRLLPPELLAAAMATSAAQRITRSLLWGAIGTNVYVFAQWQTPPAPPPPAPSAPRLLPWHGYHTLHAPAVARNAHHHHYQYMRDHYTVSARNLDAGRWYTLLTSAFSHAQPLHLAVNMFMLHQATTIASSHAVMLGPARIVALALVSALGGSLGGVYGAHAAGTARFTDMQGASGMVQGMLVATACAAPRLPMSLMLLPVPIAYSTLVAGFIAWDLWNLYKQHTRGPTKNWLGQYIGYAAHLGGAVSGAVFYLVAMRRGKVPPLPFRRL